MINRISRIYLVFWILAIALVLNGFKSTGAAPTFRVYVVSLPKWSSSPVLVCRTLARCPSTPTLPYIPCGLVLSSQPCPRLHRAPIMIMAPKCHIHHLADELLSEILSFVLRPGPHALSSNSSPCDSDREGSHGARLVDIQPIGYGEASDLDRFRLVCKRFMRIGTPRRFARFVLRFSVDGFQRLADLREMQLACYVKTVTYLVRPFYQGSGMISSSTPCGDGSACNRTLEEKCKLAEREKLMVHIVRASRADDNRIHKHRVDAHVATSQP